VEGSEFTLDVDMVIAAIGQAPDVSYLADELQLADSGNRIVTKDLDTLATPVAGVFAGGDAVTGPATAIKAIAAGKSAALSIDLYLKGESGSSLEPGDVVEKAALSSKLIEKTGKFARCQKTSLATDQRLKGFDEVDSVLPEEAATKEALRCLHCYLGAKVDQEKCVSCLTCVRVCPLNIPTTNKMGEITIDPVTCQACGVCVFECPVRAIDIDLDPRSEVGRDIEEGIRGAQHSGPVIVGFFDLHGNFGSSHVESLKEDYPDIVPVMVFGLRRIDTSDILKAFESGAAGVFLAACQPDRDPFPKETERVKRRTIHVRNLLEALGMDGGCLEIFDMPQKGLVEDDSVKDMIQRTT
jgi:ferredoxin/coenzyme F420-reducing hydrogenase delta subunit